MNRSPRRSALRAGAAAALVAMLCGFALLIGTGQAAAHTRLQSSDPADGASLATAPAGVSLTFNERMQAGFSTVTVIGPDGAAYQAGEVAADGATVRTAVRPLGPAGRYEIGYRVVSDDGHPVTGIVVFTLTAAGPGAVVPAAPTSPEATPADPPPAVTPAAATSADTGAPVWPWIVAGVVLLGGGVVAALRLGRG